MQWTRVIDEHIQDIEGFGGDCFLAVGGLSHLTLSGGAAFLVTRDKSGDWVSKKVFTSEAGVPAITGTSFTDAFLTADSKKLVVIGLRDSLGIEPFFGVDSTGVVHYFGESLETKKSEQDVPPKSDRAGR